jgi:hypothetical protein
MSMTEGRRSAGTSTLGAGLCGIGAALAVRPEQIARRLSGAGPAPPRVLTTVLGGRLMAQGLLTWTRPTRGALLVSCSAELAHLASMVLAADLYPGYRRPAIASAGLAAVTAGLTAALAVRRSSGPATRAS